MRRQRRSLAHMCIEKTATPLAEQSHCSSLQYAVCITALLARWTAACLIACIGLLLGLVALAKETQAVVLWPLTFCVGPCACMQWAHTLMLDLTGVNPLSPLVAGFHTIFNIPQPLPPGQRAPSKPAKPAASSSVTDAKKTT